MTREVDQAEGDSLLVRQPAKPWYDRFLARFPKFPHYVTLFMGLVFIAIFAILLAVSGGWIKEILLPILFGVAAGVESILMALAGIQMKNSDKATRSRLWRTIVAVLTVVVAIALSLLSETFHLFSLPALVVPIMFTAVMSYRALDGVINLLISKRGETQSKVVPFLMVGLLAVGVPLLFIAQNTIGGWLSLAGGALIAGLGFYHVLQPSSQAGRFQRLRADSEEGEYTVEKVGRRMRGAWYDRFLTKFPNFPTYLALTEGGILAAVFLIFAFALGGPIKSIVLPALFGVVIMLELLKITLTVIDMKKESEDKARLWRVIIIALAVIGAVGLSLLSETFHVFSVPALIVPIMFTAVMAYRALDKLIEILNSDKRSEVKSKIAPFLMIGLLAVGVPLLFIAENNIGSWLGFAGSVMMVGFGIFNVACKKPQQEYAEVPAFPQGGLPTPSDAGYGPIVGTYDTSPTAENRNTADQGSGGPRFVGNSEKPNSGSSRVLQSPVAAPSSTLSA